MVDYEREMISQKSCKYGGYGSFEHVLFLFCVGAAHYDRQTEESAQLECRQESAV